MTDAESGTGNEAELSVAEDQAASEAEAETEAATAPGEVATETATGPGAATASPGRLVVGPGSKDAVIRAEHVEFSQGGASRVDATTVSLSQGGAGRINAREVTISQGGAGLVRTESFNLETDGNAVVVVARTARIADDARVVVLIAGRTEGAARPLLDWQSALALVGGVVVLRRLLGMFRRR